MLWVIWIISISWGWVPTSLSMISSSPFTIFHFLHWVQCNFRGGFSRRATICRKFSFSTFRFTFWMQLWNKTWGIYFPFLAEDFLSSLLCPSRLKSRGLFSLSLAIMTWVSCISWLVSNNKLSIYIFGITVDID